MRVWLCIGGDALRGCGALECACDCSILNVERRLIVSIVRRWSDSFILVRGTVSRRMCLELEIVTMITYVDFVCKDPKRCFELTMLHTDHADQERATFSH